MKAVFHLAERAGGWSRIHPYVVESVVLADKYAALTYGTPPAMHPSVFDPGPAITWSQGGPCTITDDSFSTMGQGLSRASLSAPLLCAAEDVIEYVRTAHVCWLKCDALLAEIESWLFLRLQSLIYRLTLLRDLQPLEDCVRLTVLVFLLHNTEYHGSKVSARTLVGPLHAALVAASLVPKGFRDPLLFWCLCTGAMTLPSVEQKWFKDTVVCNLSMLPEQTEEELEKALQPYIFLPDRQRTQLRALLT